MPSVLDVLTTSLLLVTFGCRGQADDCERAFARLDRITASRGQRMFSSQARTGALETCRHGKYASYDPVLRCAMDAKSDGAAAACIDELVKSVVTPGVENAEQDGGKALNPLVDDVNRPTR